VGTNTDHTSGGSGEAEAARGRNDELEQLLKNLRLKRILEIRDELLHTAEKEDVSYSEFLLQAGDLPEGRLHNGSQSFRSLFDGAAGYHNKLRYRPAVCESCAADGSPV